MSITTEVLYIFRKKYDDDAVVRKVMRDHPFFTRIKKKSGFTGEGEFYSIKTANPQGVSSGFAEGQAAISTSRGKKPYLTRFTKYGFIRLKGEDMHAAPNGGAFYDYVTDQTDSILEQMGHDMAFDLTRDGSGMRGRISSIAGQVLTLSVADDVRNFSEGMTVVGDDVATGATPNPGTTTVTAVGKTTVTVTSVAAANLIANDYLFRYGDGNACAEGIANGTPLAAPTAGESWRGIDRSSNEPLLSGIRIDDTSAAIEDNIGLAAIEVKRNGQAQDECYLNPTNFYAVVRRTNSKVVYDGGGGDATIGFESIKVATPAGVVTLVSDPDFATNRGYGMRMDEHLIRHMEGLPHIVKDGSGPAVTVYNADSIEIRGRAWWNYRQDRPACFSVISI